MHSKYCPRSGSTDSTNLTVPISRLDPTVGGFFPILDGRDALAAGHVRGEPHAGARLLLADQAAVYVTV